MIRKECQDQVDKRQVSMLKEIPKSLSTILFSVLYPIDNHLYVLVFSGSYHAVSVLGFNWEPVIDCTDPVSLV